MTPLLLRPKILAIKNRLKVRRQNKSLRRQDVLIFFFACVLGGLIFRATYDSLIKLQELAALAYLPSSQILSLVLTFLFVMLLISNAAIAVGSFFLSDDLDLLLASPIQPLRLFVGRVLTISFSATWMPICFCTPFLLAFGIAYHAPFSYYAFAPAIILPYLILPAICGCILALILMLCVPGHRAREVLFIVFLIALVLVYRIVQLLRSTHDVIPSAQEVLRVVSILSLADRTWLPSAWAASCLRELLEPRSANLAPEFILLYASCFVAASFGYLLFKLSYSIAHSRARNTRRERARHLSNDESALRRYTAEKFPQTVALLQKDFRFLCREMSQLLQMVMLLMLCMVYLYNLRIFKVVENLPESIQLSWRQFLYVGNVSMGAFLTTAICTRFVFPSISLEGRSFWILAASPISMRQLMRTKFWFWIVPVAIVTSLFFAIGSYTLGAPAELVLASAFCAAVLSYGIVGVAIGCGSYFSSFSWEHSSELAASFGSMIYMLLSISLVVLSAAPAVGVLYLYEHNVFQMSADALQLNLGICVSVLIVIAINYYSARFAMRWGENELLRRLD